MRIFTISHLRRGGGHAVALWMFRHFDDAAFSNSTGDEFKRNIVRGLGTDIVATYEDSVSRTDCYILRDAYNTFASRMKVSIKSPNRVRTPSHGWHGERDVDLWCRFADRPVTFTLFPRFTRDKEYRLSEAHRLALPNPDRDPDLTEVAPFGGGSSFTGVRVDGPDMKLESRYTEFLGQPWFTSILNNNWVRELNDKHFGWYLDRDGSIKHNANLCSPNNVP